MHTSLCHSDNYTCFVLICKQVSAFAVRDRANGLLLQLLSRIPLAHRRQLSHCICIFVLSNFCFPDFLCFYVFCISHCNFSPGFWLAPTDVSCQTTGESHEKALSRSQSWEFFVCIIAINTHMYPIFSFFPLFKCLIYNMQLQESALHNAYALQNLKPGRKHDQSRLEILDQEIERVYVFSKNSHIRTSCN